MSGTSLKKLLTPQRAVPPLPKDNFLYANVKVDNRKIIF